MTDPLAPAQAPVRTVGADAAWVLIGGTTLAALARLLETSQAGDANVWWASALLAAVLATAPRERWAALALAAIVAFGAALAAGGEGVSSTVARAFAYTLEGLAGGWLARRHLARSHGARRPLAFAQLMMLTALAPPLVGATAAVGLLALLPAGAGTSTGLADLGARWLATCSGDSFGAVATFPLALALRRDPVARVDRREAATTVLTVVLVLGFVGFSFANVPRPFAFSSLALGGASLVVGTRTVFLLVWGCMTIATIALGGAPLPPHDIAVPWQQLNVFLPAIAIAAPIQVLSVALQRLSGANRVLQRSRERFQRLYDRAPVMLQSLDGGGRTTEVNAQWLATLGYASAEDVRGLAFEHFLMPDERSTSETAWQRRLLEADVHKLHVRLRTHAGKTIHALASAASAPDDPAGAHGVVLALEDVSVELAMRAEMERERDQLAALTSATSDLAVFLDEDLRYRIVNRAFERYWGVARHDVIGRRPRDVAGQGFFSADIAGRLADALAGAASDFRSTIEFPSGPRVMEIALAPAYDAGGRRAGVVATLHDVTELVDATAELKMLVAELQHVNEGLEQFARIASHDLREPLNTITQFSGLIEEDFGAQLPGEATRYFALMGKASKRMKEMLDDVLQFARLERMPQAALDRVALDTVFADLRTLLHARLAQTGARLEVEPSLPAVLGQSGLLELLFQNLLINAMRYTAPGIQPNIAVTARHIGDLVVVTVADDGIGIPANQLERIFVPFHRRQDYHPAGDSALGLATCRRIATALGGRIWAESEGGRGTQLNVALQAATLA